MIRLIFALCLLLPFVGQAQERPFKDLKDYQSRFCACGYLWTRFDIENLLAGGGFPQGHEPGPRKHVDWTKPRSEQWREIYLVQAQDRRPSPAYHPLSPDSSCITTLVFDKDSCDWRVYKPLPPYPRTRLDSLEARLDSLVLELKIKDIDLKFQIDILAADLWRAHIQALHTMAVSGLSLQTQIDSLEAKLKRAHIVGRRVMIANGDSAWWEISFDPE